MVKPNRNLRLFPSLKQSLETNPHRSHLRINSTNPWVLNHFSPQLPYPQLPSLMEQNSTTTQSSSRTFMDRSTLLKSRRPPFQKVVPPLHQQQQVKTGQTNLLLQSTPRPKDLPSNIGKSTPFASAGKPHGKAYKLQHTSSLTKST